MRAELDTDFWLPGSLSIPGKHVEQHPRCWLNVNPTNQPAACGKLGVCGPGPPAQIPSCQFRNAAASSQASRTGKTQSNFKPRPSAAFASGSFRTGWQWQEPNKSRLQDSAGSPAHASGYYSPGAPSLRTLRADRFQVQWLYASNCGNKAAKSTVLLQ